MEKHCGGLQGTDNVLYVVCTLTQGKKGVGTGRWEEEEQTIRNSCATEMT